MTLKRMSLSVSEELYNNISDEAEKRGLTMNAVIIFALENYYMQMQTIPNIEKLMTMAKMLEKNID